MTMKRLRDHFGDGFKRNFPRSVFAAATFNFPPFTAVEEQKDANPEFPTVKFPNPEEKGKWLKRQISSVSNTCFV